MQLNKTHIKFILILSFSSIAFSQGILGDVKQDGTVDILDIVRTVNIIIGDGEPPTDYELWASDVNDDAETNIQDVIIIEEYILGAIPIECPEYKEPCQGNYAQCCFEITSHEFTWEIDTFGVGANSFSELHDVFIIDENDIWVVGTIQWPDTTSPPFYNALHWNGTEWEGVQIIDQNGICNWGFSFFAFDPSDMWFGSTRPHHFDGESWFKYGSDEGFPSNISHPDKIWGTSFDNMFFFQRTADIVHFDGAEFTIMETSTGSGDGWISNPNFENIWGKDETHIWAFSRGSTTSPIWDFPQTIQFFDGNEWSDLYYFDTYDTFDGVLNPPIANMWGFEDTLYIMTFSTGFWKESIITGEGYYSAGSDLFYGYRGRGMKGNHPNDIITVNWQGQYAHYNGEEWSHHTELAEYFNYGDASFRGMAFKDNTVIFYGPIYQGFDWPVFIARGTRSE